MPVKANDIKDLVDRIDRIDLVDLIDDSVNENRSAR